MGIPYTPAIDMWSTGCILYELYTGQPLFAGENEIEQLACIMEVKGVPPKSVIKVSFITLTSPAMLQEKDLL